MMFGALSVELGEAVGLIDVTDDPTAGTLTFRFTNRAEVWRVAPPDYPCDGSLELIKFGGRYYVPPTVES